MARQTSARVKKKSRSSSGQTRRSSTADARNYVLEDQVGHLLRRANQRHTAIFAERMDDTQLTPMQFAVLVKVRDEGEVSQNKLGRLAAMDPATVQGVVKRLEERELLEARPDSSDKRRSLWRLSQRGTSLLNKAIADGFWISEATLAPIPAGQRKLLISLLKRLS